MSVHPQLESSRNLTTDDFIQTALKQAPGSGDGENAIADPQRALRKRKRGKRCERRPLADIQNRPLEHPWSVEKGTKRSRIDAVQLGDSIVSMKDGTCTEAKNVLRQHFNSTIAWPARRQDDV